MRACRRQDLITFFALTFGYLAWTWLWLYRGGFAEHDCYVAASAIVQAKLQGTGLNEPMLYFPVSQPLYYLLFFHWPGAPWMSLDHLIPLMNGLSWLAMGLAVGLLYCLFRSVATMGWALAGVTAVVTGQTFFEMSTYTHPTSLSLFLTLLGTFVLVRGFATEKNGLEPKQWGALLGFGVCYFCAFYMRVDIVLLFPFVLVLLFATAKRRWRAVGIACGITLAILASYPLINRLLFNPQAVAGKRDGSLVQTLMFFLQARISVGLFYYFYAIGAGAALALGLTVLFLVYRRRWIPLGYGLFAIGLPLLYFLANPQPSRRFMPVIVAGGLIVAMGGSSLRRLRRPWPAVLCALILGLNLGSPVLFRGLCRLGHRDVSQLILARLGESPFENHRIRQNYAWWDYDRWDTILSTAKNDSLFIGMWVDLAGFYYHNTLHGEIVKTRPIRMESNAHLFSCTVGKRHFYFLEWYSGANPDIIPVKHDQVYILTPLKPAELNKLPAGIQYTTTPELLRRRDF